MSDRRTLLDTSVLARAQQPLVTEQMRNLAFHGRLRTCRMVDLDYAYIARAKDITTVINGRRRVQDVPIRPDTMEHALDIMEALAEAGFHRGAKPADCVIAACALESGLTLLHYDSNFDRIAAVTGLDAEWVAPPGSLDQQKGGAT